MCRWIAYSGPRIALSSLLTRPDHSLIDQGVRSREGAVTTNGDGFGVGWYDGSGMPGCYRETRPVWNDPNLRNLAEHVRSALFLAHVRASSGTPVQQTNCHPFRYGRWLFQHNGSVEGFERVKRDVLMSVDPQLFSHIEGSTDSEALFFLALTYGLERDPKHAIERVVGLVESLLRDVGAEGGLTLSAAATDGTKLFATRYATDERAPSLYHSRHIHALHAVDGSYEPLPEGAVLLVSEPLDELTQHWTEVPEASWLVVEGGRARVTPFTPRR